MFVDAEDAEELWVATRGYVLAGPFVFGVFMFVRTPKL